MLTLEQWRAKDAWDRSSSYTKEHVKLAKGLPALIMNSGLMQVMAFLHEKSGNHEAVSTDLRRWLCLRFPALLRSPNFEDFMQALLDAPPLTIRPSPR